MDACLGGLPDCRLKPGSGSHGVRCDAQDTEDVSRGYYGGDSDADEKYGMANDMDDI